MSNLKACFPSGIVRVRFTCDTSAHLAGKAVSIKDESPGLFRDPSFESGQGFGVEQKILARLEIALIVVRENLIALLSSQLANSTRQFTCIARGSAEFSRLQHLTDIRQQVGSEFRPASRFITLCHALKSNRRCGPDSTGSYNSLNSRRLPLQKAGEMHFPPADKIEFFHRRIANRRESPES